MLPAILSGKLMDVFLSGEKGLVLPKPVAHIALQIADSRFLSQTPAIATGPWTQASSSHGVPVYLQIYCSVLEACSRERLTWGRT